MAALAALVLAGCGGPIGPSHAAPLPARSTASPQRVLLTVTRAGGRDASWDRITVGIDGTWFRYRGTHRRQGTLPGTSLERIRTTVTDPRLPAELTVTDPAAAVTCPDGYHYVVESTGLRGAAPSCPSPARPLTGSLLIALNETAATP